MTGIATRLSMRVALAARLAVMFTRRTTFSSGAIMTFLVCALLMATFAVLTAASLGPEQRIARDLGRWDSRMSVDLDAAGSDSPAGDLRAIALDTGATEATVLLSSVDVRPDLPGRPFSVYTEGDWATNPFPATYRLVSGRWPTQAGEVVVTRAIAQYVVHGRLRVLSGETLIAVGQVENRFSQRSSEILAAPGTQATFDWGRIAERFPTAAMTPLLMWTGPSDPVVNGLATFLAADNRFSAASSDDWLFSLQSSRTQRTNLLGDRTTLVDSTPLAFSVPSLVLVPLTALAAFAISLRRARRTLAVLRGVGTPNAVAVTGIAAGGAALVILAAVAGVVAGVAAAVPLRALLPLALTQPVSPWPDLWQPAGRLILLTAAAVVAAVAGFVASQASLPWRALMAAAPLRALSPLVPITAAIGLVWLLWVVNGDGPGSRDAIVVPLSLFVLSGVPLVMNLVTAAIPGVGPAARLARRRARIHQARFGVTVALTAMLLGVFWAFAIAWRTSSDIETINTISLVPRGQVLVTTEGPSPPPSGVVNVIRQDVGSTAREMQLWEPVETNRNGERVATVRGNGLGAVLIVDSISDARALGSLGTDAADTLQAGGLVLFGETGEAGERPLYVSSPAGDTPTAEIPFVSAPFDRSWEQSYAGMILTDTARRLDLPLLATDTVFAAVPDLDGDAIRSDLIERGYNPAYAKTYRLQDRLPFPVVYWYVGAVLAIATAGTLFLLVRAQALALRPYAAGLIAIGASKRFPARVLAWEAMAATIAGVALAAVIAVVPTLLLGLRYDLPVLVSVPWAIVGMTIGVVVVMVVTAVTTNALALRPSAREID